jgi:hypothetical protein
MYRDEVLSEVWKNREEYAREHGHDLRAIVEDLKKRQRNPFSRLVDRTGNKVSPDASDTSPTDPTR